MKKLNVINKLCQECIKEGEKVVTTKWSRKSMGGIRIANPTTYVDLEQFKKWHSNCKVLLNMLGDLSKPWEDSIGGSKSNELTNAKSILGAVKSIEETINNGYLISIEDLIYAEAFCNLIEQAEYLFGEGYLLAAGVVTRAVLEAKLRGLCTTNQYEINKERPALSDYYQQLYKQKYISKIELKKIEYLTSIGNNAAHNKKISKDDVENFIIGVKEILEKYD